MLIVSIIVYGIILVIELVKFNNALKKGKQREPYITTTVIAFGYITGVGVIETKQMIYLFIFLNIMIFINGFIIKYKTHHIKMNKEESFFQDTVSDWDKKNIVKMAESVTYIGIGLIIASFVYSGSSFDIDKFSIKVLLFSLGYHKINTKMLKIENEKYMKNILKINISLVLGLIFNVTFLLAASYYKLKIIDNYDNVCDCIIGASFLSLIPILNQYSKMAILMKKIRYTQDMNNENLF